MNFFRPLLSVRAVVYAAARVFAPLPSPPTRLTTRDSFPATPGGFRISARYYFSAWYAGDYVLGLIVCIALVVFGFYTSLAGEPLFRDSLPDD